MGGVNNAVPCCFVPWGLVVCALALGLPACGERETLSMPSASVSGALPGAWILSDPWHEEVQEAARFAVQTFAVQQRSRVLYKDVMTAEQQVVTGLNFKLRLQVQHDTAVRVAEVTVWRQLSGQYQLINWVWQD